MAVSGVGTGGSAGISGRSAPLVRHPRDCVNRGWEVDSTHPIIRLNDVSCLNWRHPEYRSKVPFEKDLTGPESRDTRPALVIRLQKVKNSYSFQIPSE